MTNTDQFDRIMTKMVIIAAKIPKRSFIEMLNDIFGTVYYYATDSYVEKILDNFITAFEIHESQEECDDTINHKLDILFLIKSIWTKYPDLRFMQLIINALPCLDQDMALYAGVTDEAVYDNLKVIYNM